MKYNIEPINNGIKISDITNRESFEFILSESIDLSWIISRLADTAEHIELDFSKMTKFHEEEVETDNYQEILNLGRILFTIFTSHENTLKELTSVK